MAIQFEIGARSRPSSKEDFFNRILADEGPIGPRPHLYGADAGYCFRKNYLLSQDWGDETVDWSPTSQIYMGIGTGVEEAISKGLMRHDRLLFNNLYLPPMEPVVRGKIDFLYLDENDEVNLAELKTCGNLPTEPKVNHLAQLKTYSAVSGYDRNQIIYVSRNVADPASGFKKLLIKVFPIELTREDHVETLRRICLSHLAIENDFMPSIPADFTKSRNCGYCPFYDICWGDREVDFEELSYKAEAEFNEEAIEMAERLVTEREYRKVKSLRHVYRNLSSLKLKQRVIREIELYEEF